MFTYKIILLSYTQALSNEHKADWEGPIRKELEFLRKQNVFTIIPKLPSLKLVPVKWVFTVKVDNTKKACVVAVGRNDTEKYEKDEIASPTPNSISI